MKQKMKGSNKTWTSLKTRWDEATRMTRAVTKDRESDGVDANDLGRASARLLVSVAVLADGVDTGSPGNVSDELGVSDGVAVEG